MSDLPLRITITGSNPIEREKLLRLMKNVIKQREYMQVKDRSYQADELVLTFHPKAPS